MPIMIPRQRIVGRKPMLGQQPDNGHWARQGLVGHWIMNEGGGNRIYDMAGNNYHLNFVNTPSWNVGKKGSAVKFLSANSDYARSPNSSDIDLGSTSITITMWIKAFDVSGVKNLLAKYASNETGAGYRIRLNGGQLEFVCADTGASATTVSGSGVVLQDVWYFCVFINDKSSSTGMKIWWNNIVSPSFRWTNGTGVGSLSNAKQFGLATRDGSDPGLYHNGVIDNVRIYTRALATSEIFELFDNEYPEYTSLPIWAGVAVVAGGTKAGSLALTGVGI
jgi:hypothetical protein